MLHIIVINDILCERMKTGVRNIEKHSKINAFSARNAVYKAGGKFGLQFQLVSWFIFCSKLKPVTLVSVDMWVVFSMFFFFFGLLPWFGGEQQTQSDSKHNDKKLQSNIHILKFQPEKREKFFFGVRTMPAYTHTPTEIQMGEKRNDRRVFKNERRKKTLHGNGC